MLDICLLGTGGMMPLPYRYLSSLMLRYKGSSILIDCGEGTQVAIKKYAWSPSSIDFILITHFHADHIAGLPGLLLTIGNCDRKEDLLMIGPKGLENVVNSLLVIAKDLPFKIKFKELEEKKESFNIGEYRIEAFRLKHNVVCYGYNVHIDRAGKFDIKKAEENAVPMKFWSRLQKDEIIEDDDRVYIPDMVLSEKRKGLKISYCTDTRPTSEMASLVEGSDIFICEGMYGDREKFRNSKDKKHMIMEEAAIIAKEALVSELWLTHYSPAMNKPEEYLDKMKEIFPNTKITRDGYIKELRFEND